MALSREFFTDDIRKSLNNWAMKEALRLLDHLDWKAPKKGYILLEAGYGPSGLPHIGTFGEVARLSYIRFAISIIAPEIPVKLFVFSDDLDGMRKVPDNLPQPEMLKKYIGYPLTSIPDPFAEKESYGDYMNTKLKSFLDAFGFEYQFCSATDYYKNGKFNNMLMNAASKCQNIMDIMLPTLGEDRQKTYSPFLPIDPETGKIYTEGVKGIDSKTGEIVFIDDKGIEKKVNCKNGGCKLQWKPDFGGRWADLEVDYEPYGKDHRPNTELYRSLCIAMGGNPPLIGFFEHFLDEEHKKISKSKGNGITIDQWLKYGNTESLGLFMLHKPETAKSLYFGVIPKAVDDYEQFEKNYNPDLLNSENKDEVVKILNNPALYINYGKKVNIKDAEHQISFAILLNLASVSNSEKAEDLWKYINRYNPMLTVENCPKLTKFIEYAVNYYQDYVKPSKKHRQANEIERKFLLTLKEDLIKFLEQNKGIEGILLPNLLQDLVYNSAHRVVIPTKDCFAAIYQVLLGAESGPRAGSFIAIYGISNFVLLIDQKL